MGRERAGEPKKSIKLSALLIVNFRFSKSEYVMIYFGSGGDRRARGGDLIGSIACARICQSNSEVCIRERLL